MTHAEATRKYEEAKAAYSVVCRAHDKVVADYRARVVGDDVFLASRARFQAAIYSVDAAETAVLVATLGG